MAKNRQMCHYFLMNEVNSVNPLTPSRAALSHKKMGIYFQNHVKIQKNSIYFQNHGKITTKQQKKEDFPKK